MSDDEHRCISCGGLDPRCGAYHPEYGFTCILPPHNGPHYDTAGGHWDMRGQLYFTCSDQLRTDVAIVLADAMDHEQDWDIPDGPCCDSSMPCHHEPEPGCSECGISGWPCEYSLSLADALITTGLVHNDQTSSSC